MSGALQSSRPSVWGALQPLCLLSIHVFHPQGDAPELCHYISSHNNLIVHFLALLTHLQILEMFTECFLPTWKAKLEGEQELAMIGRIFVILSCRPWAPSQHQCLEPGLRYCSVPRALCILEDLGGPLVLEKSSVGQIWEGNNPALQSEKQQDRGCDTFRRWACLLLSLLPCPWLFCNTPWGDCLEQWEPPRWSHLLNVWVLLLGAASCPCHRPDLPSLPWVGLTTTLWWHMETHSVMARGIIRGDAAWRGRSGEGWRAWSCSISHSVDED